MDASISRHFKSLGILVFAIAIPCLVIWQYHAVNTYFPRSDEGDYFKASYQIFETFKNEGVLSGLKALYMVRCWKVILHPVVGALFLLFTKGNALLSVKIASVTLYATILVFVLRFFRLFQDRLSAAFSTFFIGMIPWLAADAFTLNPELGLLASSSAALFYFSRIELFDQRQDQIKFGFAIALACCIRPVETVLFWSIPLIVLSIQKKRFALRFWIPILAIPIIWFGPFIRELWDWIYSTSLGNYAIQTGGRQNTSYWEQVFHVVGALGLYPLFAVSLLTIPALRPTNFKSKAWLSILLAAAVFPIFCGALSANADKRYYLLSALTLFEMATLFALLQENRWLKFKQALVFSFGILLAWATLDKIHQEPRPQWLEIFSENRIIYKPNAGKGTDPSQEIILNLEPLLPKKIKSIGIVRHNSPDLYLPLDMWALELVARTRGFDWRIDSPWLFDYKDQAEGIKTWTKSFEYVLFGGLNVTPIAQDQLTQVTDILIQAYKQNDLERFSLQPIAEIPYTNYEGKPEKLVLAKVL